MKFIWCIVPDTKRICTYCSKRSPRLSAWYFAFFGPETFLPDPHRAFPWTPSRTPSGLAPPLGPISPVAAAESSQGCAHMAIALGWRKRLDRIISHHVLQPLPLVCGSTLTTRNRPNQQGQRQHVEQTQDKRGAGKSILQLALMTDDMSSPRSAGRTSACA